jgi:hypothetical protein
VAENVAVAVAAVHRGERTDSVPCVALPARTGSTANPSTPSTDEPHTPTRPHLAGRTLRVGDLTAAKAMSSPTSRSIEKLKAEGWTVWKAEHWCPFSKRRKDAFGFADLIAMKPSVRGVLFVQTTSGTNVSARLAKMQMTAAVEVAMAAGNSVICHGWAKRGKRGERKLWSCREVNMADVVKDGDSEPEVTL